MRGPGSGDPIEAERVRRGARARLFAEALEPLRLGRFEVRDRIGIGGMGVVYAAFDPELDRQVAVKLLTDDEAGARLLDEARAMAAVRHPCLVAVHDVGQWQDHVFLAMELVAGPSLREWLRAAPRRAAEVVAAFVGVGRALAALHGAGLVHRDFKPDNVVIDDDGRARLVDFGLARRADVAGGELAGTPAYLAPELVRGAPPTAASDQYAFCVALGGCGVGLPRRVKRLIARGTAASPQARLPSMTALVDALEHDPGARWRRGAAVAAVAGGIGVAVALAVGPEHAPQRAACDGGAARLAQIWNPARRDAVTAAFDATGVPYAAASRASVEARLDAYAGHWRTAHRDACEATHVRHEQSSELLDLRMLCLDRRLIALDATVDVLAAADAAMIERALSIADSLPPLESCGDADALRAILPPPEDADVRARLAELEPRRAAGAALAAAARFDQAIADLETLSADARALGYRPFEAEALLELGIARNAANRDSAHDTYFEAVTAGQASGHQRVVADAALRLAGAHIFLEEWREAQTWTGMADATIEALGEDPRLRAALHGVMTQLLFNQGKYTEAHHHAGRSVAMLEERGDADTAAYATALTNLGMSLSQLDQPVEALRHLDEGLALRERLLGASHPAIADTLNVIGIIEEDLEHYPEALARYQRAHQIVVASAGPESVAAARYLDHQAGVLRRLDREDEAMRLRLEALRIREATLPPTSSELSTSYANLGAMLTSAGRYDEAEARIQQALAIDLAAYGPDHPEVAAIWRALGDVAVHTENWTGALERHGKSIAAYEASLGKDNAELVLPLIGVGVAHLGREQPAEAIVALERAVRIAEQRASRPSELARARFFLAVARLEAGDVAGARRDAEQARADWTAIGRDDQVAQVDAFLAEASP